MRVLLTSRFQLASFQPILQRMTTRLWEFASGIKQGWRSVMEIEFPPMNKLNATKLFKKNIKINDVRMIFTHYVYSCSFYKSHLQICQIKNEEYTI